jgi:hypothetical protein
MKTLRLSCLAALLINSASFVSVHGQIYSAKRLTQRIAPQLPPAQTSLAQPGAGLPAARVVVPVVPPATSLAISKPAATEPETPATEPEAGPATSERVPMVIQCAKVQPDPRESLQYVSLSLSNTCTSAINQITMSMTYYDASGLKLKEWKTKRDLNWPLPANKSTELVQPAYFMPLSTRQVKVEVVEARFLDGKEWEKRESASISPGLEH